MVVLASAVLAALALVLVGNLIYLRRGPSPAPPPVAESRPLISILVPARNEEAEIGDLLRSLASQNYPNYEVVVFDDASEDGTGTVVREAARTAEDHGYRLSYLRGDGPPEARGRGISAHQSGAVYRSHYAALAAGRGDRPAGSGVAQRSVLDDRSGDLPPTSAAPGRPDDGERWKTDLVVSNADAVHTYEHLIGGVGRSRLGRARMRQLEHSMSCFLLYLGVRTKFEKLRHHTIVVSDRYEGLLTDIFDRKVLPEDFSMYLHAPTRTDSSMAPPGGESLYVLVPVPNLAGETDWERHAPAFEEEVIDRLEAWGLTGLREHLEVRRRFTPIDFQESYNAVRGHAFAIEPKLSQTAYFRPANRSRSIDGLYLVGADTHPGAGVPGVMLSAESTEHAIRENLGVPLPDQVSSPDRASVSE